MGLTVHGSPYSTCSQRVFTALAEKGVEADLRTLDFATQEHKKPDFLKLQPFGKVPVLEDDGYFVFESRAIAKYIAKKYAGQGTKLIPDESDVKAYGLFEQVCWIDFGGCEREREGLLADEGCRLARSSRAISMVQQAVSASRRSSSRKTYLWKQNNQTKAS